MSDPTLEPGATPSRPQAEAEAAPRGPSRKVFWAMAIVLALSLGLNAAILGFVAGRGHSGGGKADMMAIGGFLPGDLRRAAKQMDDADRAVLRRVFIDRRDTFKEMRREFHPLTKAVRQALVAEPFDPEALERAFDDLRGQGQDMADLFQGAVMEAARELSPAGRKTLAHLRRGPHGGSGEPGRYHRGPKP